MAALALAVSPEGFPAQDREVHWPELWHGSRQLDVLTVM